MGISNVYNRDIMDAVKELEYNRGTAPGNFNSAVPVAAQKAPEIAGGITDVATSGSWQEAIMRMLASTATNTAGDQSTKQIDDPAMTEEQRRNKEQGGMAGGTVGGIAGSIGGGAAAGSIGGPAGALVGGIIGALGAMIGRGAGRAAGNKSGTWYEAMFGE